MGLDVAKVMVDLDQVSKNVEEIARNSESQISIRLIIMT